MGPLASSVSSLLDEVQAQAPEPAARLRQALDGQVRAQLGAVDVLALKGAVQSAGVSDPHQAEAVSVRLYAYLSQVLTGIPVPPSPTASESVEGPSPEAQRDAWRERAFLLRAQLDQAEERLRSIVDGVSELERQRGTWVDSLRRRLTVVERFAKLAAEVDAAVREARSEAGAREQLRAIQETLARFTEPIRQALASPHKPVFAIAATEAEWLALAIVGRVPSESLREEPGARTSPLAEPGEVAGWLNEAADILKDAQGGGLGELITQSATRLLARFERVSATLSLWTDKSMYHPLSRERVQSVLRAALARPPQEGVLEEVCQALGIIPEPSTVAATRAATPRGEVKGPRARPPKVAAYVGAAHGGAWHAYFYVYSRVRDDGAARWLRPVRQPKEGFMEQARAVDFIAATWPSLDAMVESVSKDPQVVLVAEEVKALTLTEIDMEEAWRAVRQ